MAMNEGIRLTKMLIPLGYRARFPQGPGCRGYLYCGHSGAIDLGGCEALGGGMD